METLTANGFTYRVVLPDLVRHDRAALRISLELRPEPGDAQRAHELPPPARLRGRHEAAGRATPVWCKPIALPSRTSRGAPSRASRSPRTSTRRRQARVPPTWASTTPASGPRASSRWSAPTSSSTSYGKDARITSWSTTRDDRRPGRQPGRLQPLPRGPFAARPSTMRELRDRSTRAPARGPADGRSPTGAELPRRRRTTRTASSGQRRQPAAPRLRTSNRNSASTPTATTAASGAAPARARPEPTTPSAARRRSPSPRRRTSASWSRSRQVDDADHQPHLLRPGPAPAAASRRRGPDPPDERTTRRSATRWPPQNGYASQYGYQLYDTTGTTEDWSYFATGGLGFTFEIGRAAQSLTNVAPASPTRTW